MCILIAICFLIYCGWETKSSLHIIACKLAFNKLSEILYQLRTGRQTDYFQNVKILMKPQVLGDKTRNY